MDMLDIHFLICFHFDWFTLPGSASPAYFRILKLEASLHLPRGNSLALQVAGLAEQTDIQIIWIIFVPGGGP
jgi:hypothetical protein